VAVLFLLRAKTLRSLSLVSKNRFNVGVLGSRSRSNQSPRSPEIDPLNEECSLSPGSSLNQLLASVDSPPVCWRIQSSVKPCVGRRARFAKTAALISPSCDTKSGSVCDLVNVGAGRRNGVWKSR
jgi:hypothetical protein